MLLDLMDATGNRSPFNPVMTNVPHHKETSQLICITDHLTGFYMMGNLGR